jgi:hypothetical protein
LIRPSEFEERILRGRLSLRRAKTAPSELVNNSTSAGNWCSASSGGCTAGGIYNQEDNGGPTRTIQLLASSPALDAVPLEACTDAGAALTTDQRGVTRPQGAGCDIGAFERVPSPYVAVVVQPIKADGTSVFSANRGVVPVKFTLTSDGMPTCQLPTATVSLARIAGAVVGPVTETDYLLGADDGLNVRVDAASCEYACNLGSSSPGAGT